MEQNNGPTSPPSPFASVADFADRLLRALQQARPRGPRGQVELEEALNAAGLPTSPALVRQALLLLYRQGCISDLVPMPNGGLLLKTTGQPFTYSNGSRNP
jgi:hypothetical protein